MFRFTIRGVIVCIGAFAITVSGQAPPSVDFVRDVQPILRQNCVGCHGPSQQANGLRLDRRSSVFKSGMRRVVPGSSDNSFLYHRLVGAAYGLQMPPTAPLGDAQIRIIKAWIDQGADWPDALANEADLPPASPDADAMIASLRSGDRAALMKFVAADATLLNARGPEGSTPFMYAVRYGDVPLIKQLLDNGANPNIRNDVRATALMWAATELEKTRLLLDRGAEIDARSDDSRTALMIAAGRPGGAPIVKLLLDRGASPNPTKKPASESSPLIQAAVAGDPDSLKLLLDRGAAVGDVGGIALGLAISVNCSRCVDLLVARGLDKDAYTAALQATSSLTDVRTIRLLLDHGADPNAADSLGHTPLMYAAVADQLPDDVVRLLIERGADVSAKSQHPRAGDTGMTVLDLARLHGDTPIVALLKTAAASPERRAVPALKPVRQNTIRAAVERSLPLLQRYDASFSAKSGCVSCHNNSLAAMTIGLARRNGFRVDEGIAAGQVKVNLSYLEHQREQMQQAYFAGQAGSEIGSETFGPMLLSYILVGLDAEHHGADVNTDAVAFYLRSRQMPDGQWAYGIGDSRPPLGSGYIGQTALCMRALQLYAIQSDRADSEKAIQRAARWIAQATPRNNEDRFWQLLGLAWAGRDRAAVDKASRSLIALQRRDGGWSDLPSIDSTAYATGRALVALQSAGLSTSDPVYRRGVEFLLNSQQDDGSWYVRTRAAGFQPYFDNGFPYGVDQFISAAGTNWATMALTLASQGTGAAGTVAGLR